MGNYLILLCNLIDSKPPSLIWPGINLGSCSKITHKSTNKPPIFIFFFDIQIIYSSTRMYPTHFQKNSNSRLKKTKVTKGVYHVRLLLERYAYSTKSSPCAYLLFCILLTPSNMQTTPHQFPTDRTYTQSHNCRYADSSAFL